MSIQIGKEDRTKVREGLGEAILIMTENTPDPGNNPYAGYSTMELLRKSLDACNQPSGGHALEVIHRAMTTSDFPKIVSDVANKSLHEGFDNADESWSQWCSTGSVPNFRPVNIIRASETDDLDPVPEGTEFKYGDRIDTGISVSVGTYGKMFSITRQALINDDINVFTDLPKVHGEAAARKVGDIAYSALLDNLVIPETGNTLFHADHNNLGTGSAPGSSALDLAIKAMKTQKDLKGLRNLNIKPVYYLAPVALEGASEAFFRSEKFDDQAKDATRVNIYSGAVFKRIYEPRLDVDSEAAWYIAGAKGKTVKVFFLHGQQKPYLAEQSGWRNDGMEYKVRIDVAATAVDYRGLFKNPGAE